MATLLSIATYGSQCSVVLSNNEKVITHKLAPDENLHSTYLTSLIEDLLNDGIVSLDAVAYVSGPGSYTGLRIGSAAAKGLCYSLNVPLITISTLELLINEYLPTNKCDLICPMMDARRDEVYQAVYTAEGKLYKEESPKILSEDDFQEILTSNSILFLGSGSEKWKGKMINNTNAEFGNTTDSHSPDTLAQLTFSKFTTNSFTNISYSEPNYLKPFFIQK